MDKFRISLTIRMLLEIMYAEQTAVHYAQELARATGKGNGVLHPALARLEKAGYLTSNFEDIDESAEGRRKRRYYQLTPQGIALAEQVLGEKDSVDAVADEAKVKAYKTLIAAIYADVKTKNNGLIFSRDDIPKFAAALGINLPKNLGDIVYTFRYRADLPDEVQHDLEAGMEWVIRPVYRKPGTPKGTHYQFCMVPQMPALNAQGLSAEDHEVTLPAIIAANAARLKDEQAVLTKARYSNIIGKFLGIEAFSLQNHLRTQVDGVQIEIDELYVGTGEDGQRYVIPVQAKVGNDRVGRIQLEQDIRYCQKEYPDYTCAPVGISAAQISSNEVAVFHLWVTGDEAVTIKDKRLYHIKQI